MCYYGEYPIVRYSVSNPVEEEDARNGNAVVNANSLTRSIANAFQIAIDTYARNNPDFPPQNTERPRSILIITDRTLDPFAPILHDFSYQAMAYDLVANVDTQKIYIIILPRMKLVSKRKRFQNW